MKPGDIVKYKRYACGSDSEWNRIKNYIGISLSTNDKDFQILCNNGEVLIHLTPPYTPDDFEIIE